MAYIVIVINAIFINNFLMSRFLGICPFLGVSRKVETALGMGFAVIFVMGLAGAITFLVNGLLVNLQIEYLRTIVFILVIASLVQFVEIILKKFMTALYNALGVYLPLITTNCAVLGVAIMNVTSLESATLLSAFVNSVASGAGFTLVIVLMAAIRERLELSRIPKSLQGFPITLIIAGIMSLAFAAFSGMTI
ncbi:MAG: electron transport complex protein RnfA [Christensenellales bacterium]